MLLVAVAACVLNVQLAFAQALAHSALDPIHTLI
jgi:hypothetical protein